MSGFPQKVTRPMTFRQDKKNQEVIRTLKRSIQKKDQQITQLEDSLKNSTIKY